MPYECLELNFESVFSWLLGMPWSNCLLWGWPFCQFPDIKMFQLILCQLGWIFNFVKWVKLWRICVRYCAYLTNKSCPLFAIHSDLQIGGQYKPPSAGRCCHNHWSWWRSNNTSACFTFQVSWLSWMVVLFNPLLMGLAMLLHWAVQTELVFWGTDGCAQIHNRLRVVMITFNRAKLFGTRPLRSCTGLLRSSSMAKKTCQHAFDIAIPNHAVLT